MKNQNASQKPEAGRGGAGEQSWLPSDQQVREAGGGGGEGAGEPEAAGHGARGEPASSMSATIKT